MKILFYREFLNACSYYRCLLPSQYLNRLPNIQSTVKENITKEDIIAHDIIVFQKKFLKQDFEFLKLAKQLKKKTVYEIDDDLFHVPLWNPAFKTIDSLKLQFKTFIEQVDLVTVTCEYLRNQLLSFNRNIKILPNCIDFSRKLQPLIPPILNKNLQVVEWKKVEKHLENKIVLGWAGSPTHREDLKLITDSLGLLVNKHPNLVIIMVLGADKKLVSLVPEDRLFFVQAVKLEDYYNLLYSLKLTFGLAPLVDDIFNYSKSNLKILEYMATGSIPIASKIENYTKTLERFNNLLLISNNTRNWVSQLSQFITLSKEELLKLKQDCYQYVKQHYNIENKINLWLEAYK